MPANRHVHPDDWSPEEQIHWALIRKGLEEIDIALLAYDDLKSASQSLQFGVGQDRAQLEVRLWAAVETFLLSTGMLSDLFRAKPSADLPDDEPPRRSPERLHARRALNFSRTFHVNPADPLHVVEVRNAFVHFFDRYEALMRSPLAKEASDRGFSYRRPGKLDDWGWSLRHVDPSTLTISYLNHTVETRKVVAELTRIREAFIDYLPAQKRAYRTDKRIREKGRKLQERLGDPDEFVMPDDWERHYASIGALSPASHMLNEFVNAYNDVVRTGRVEDFSMVFHPQGTLILEFSKRQEFSGRTEIVRGLEARKPRRRLYASPPYVQTSDLVLSTFGWRQLPEGEVGIIRLKSADSKVIRADLRYIPGKPGVVTSGRGRRYGKHLHRVFRV